MILSQPLLFVPCHPGDHLDPPFYYLFVGAFSVVPSDSKTVHDRSISIMPIDLLPASMYTDRNIHRRRSSILPLSTYNIDFQVLTSKHPFIFVPYIK